MNHNNKSMINLMNSFPLQIFYKPYKLKKIGFDNHHMMDTNVGIQNVIKMTIAYLKLIQQINISKGNVSSN